MGKKGEKREEYYINDDQVHLFPFFSRTTEVDQKKREEKRKKK